MRVRTKSACVVLAWGIIMLLLAAAGPSAPSRPAQASTRIAGNTSSTSSTIHATWTSAGTRTGPSRRTDRDAYRVQPGDTLSGIAAALGTPGGWPALYAANRKAIGPNPGLIDPGTVLTLPGPTPARYTVAAGDTLSGIAAALGTPGGWPALYAANREAIGPDPNAIHPGTALAIPRLAASPSASQRAPSASPAPHPIRRPSAARPSSPARPSSLARPSVSAPSSSPARSGASASATLPASGRRRLRPAQANAPVVAGLPRWLEIVLVAAGLLIGTAFLTEPALAVARRGRAARSGAPAARIVLADYDRLVVTHSETDGTVCVLRPPGADPQAILLAARLVLAQDRYEELAGHLGVPAHWPRE